MKKITLLFLYIIASSFTLNALASPMAQPILKDGSCPSGYYSSGNYCAPTQNAKFAIIKIGSCPSGFYSSGNYCLASSDNSKLAIPKVGSCPSGFYSSGQYCVSVK